MLTVHRALVALAKGVVSVQQAEDMLNLIQNHRPRDTDAEAIGRAIAGSTPAENLPELLDMAWRHVEAVLV